MAANKTLKMITEGAVCVAMSLALMFLKIKFLPDGGSVDLVMIPLIVYALRSGFLWGVCAGAVFGTLKCILGGGIAYGWAALILDYSVAYAAVGAAGLFRQRPAMGVAAGSAARYLIHVISGVVIWGTWMPDVFLGLEMQNIWIYSILYNASYMLPSAVIAAVAVLAIGRSSELLRPNL